MGVGGGGGYLTSKVPLQCSEALLGWPGNQEKCSKGHGVGSAAKDPFTRKHEGKVSTSSGLTGGGGWKVSKQSGLKRDVVSHLGGPPTGVPVQ